MTDYLDPSMLSALETNGPKPIAQLFLTTVNETIDLNPGIDPAAAVASGTLVAFAALEHKLSQVMRVLGVMEPPKTDN